MFCDVFNKQQALKLLDGKRIWFVGSSNMRAIYKDLLWLITHGNIAPVYSFQIKNELNYLNDKRISNDTLHNGRNYKETREFKSGNTYIFFHFITRLHIDHFVDLINNTKTENFPDILLINSCLWDLTRWGPEGPKNFKINILKTMKFLKSKLPERTRVIWKTALPVSTNADGAIFIEEIKFIVPMLPWHILEANIYAGSCANFFNFDTLDVHHHMRLQGHLRVKDGIHWQPIAVRYLTNLFLTHLTLAFNQTLPGNFQPNNKYLLETTRIFVKDNELENRVNEKQGLFKKIFQKTSNAIKKTGCLQGITNKVLTVSRNIRKRKRKKALKKTLKTGNNIYYLNQSGCENNNRNHYNSGSHFWNSGSSYGSHSNFNWASNNYDLNHANYQYNNYNNLNNQGTYYSYNNQATNYYSQYNFPS